MEEVYNHFDSLRKKMDGVRRPFENFAKENDLRFSYSREYMIMKIVFDENKEGFVHHVEYGPEGDNAWINRDHDYENHPKSFLCSLLGVSEQNDKTITSWLGQAKRYCMEVLV